MQRSWITKIFVAAGAASVAAIAFAGSAGAVVPTDQVPAGLKNAIAGEVEARGREYAGLCLDIEQSDHVGEWCAFVLTLNDDEAEVTFGAVLSDETQGATFVKDGDTWAAEDDSSAQVPDDLRAAIKALIEARGEEYAGLCLEIEQSEHVGKWCAFVQSVSATSATVTFGAVLSDETHSATFTRQANGWAAVADNAPPTGTPTPKAPSTGSGSGSSGDRSTDNAPLIVIAVGAAIAGVIALTPLALRRK